MTTRTTRSLRRSFGVAIVAAAVLCISRLVSAQAAYEVVHAFAAGADAANPVSIIQALDGMFYGTTLSGGAGGMGTVFRMTPAGQVTILHAFSGPDGAAPAAALVQASDGDFYGTTRDGGAFGMGTTFKITSGGIFTPLHSFSGATLGDADGDNPISALIQATDGLLYGMTKNGADRLRHRRRR